MARERHEEASRPVQSSLPWDTEGRSYGGWGGHEYHETESGCTQNPILFVHGNSRTADDWTRHARYLLRNGYNGDELWAITFPHDSTTHEQMAELLDEFVEKIRERTGAENVDVVAHSLGVTGVRNWFHEYDGNERTQRFIAVAGANNGLPVYLRILPFGNDRLKSVLSFLRPNNGKLAELNKKKSYKDVETYTVRGKYDGLFAGRRDSPKLTEAQENRVLRAGHDGARSRITTLRLIKSWLDD